MYKNVVTETPQTETAQTETAQTETARPNRPDRNGQTEKSCSGSKLSLGCQLHCQCKNEI